MEDILAHIKDRTAAVWELNNYLDRVSERGRAQFGHDCFLLIEALKTGGYSEMLVNALVFELFKHYPNECELDGQ